MTRVSVCIATHNGGIFLEKQLHSILDQLSENDEVIISDDSSTDDTIIIIKAINDPRIVLIEHQEFYCAAKNFEHALKNAHGQYIFFSDQDDYWLSNKVSLMLEKLQTYDIVVCDAKIIDKDDTVVHESYFNLRNSGKGWVKNLLRNTYIGCCMAFHRKVLKEALPFPNLIFYHDYWIGYIGELYYSTYFLPIALTHYRQHDKNVSTAALNISNRNMLEKLKDRVVLLCYLPLLYYRYFYGKQSAPALE